MRKAFVIIAVVIVVLGVGVAVAFVNLETLINKNKGALLAKAQETIGREITLGEVGLSFRGGLGVQLSDVALADDPSFSTEPLVSAKNLQVNVKILPLFRKEFEVKRVLLREPIFNLIRNEAGVLNATTLAGSNDAGGETQAAAPLAISLVNVSDGVIHFEDRADGTTIDITDLDSKVTDFELGRPITIELDAALIDPEKNLVVSGTFGPLADNADDTPVDARIELGPIDVKSITQALPALAEGLPPELKLAGPVKVEVGAQGTAGALVLSIALDADELSAEIPASFTKAAGVRLTVASDITLSAERATLSNTRIQLHTLEATGGGQVVLGEIPTVKFDIRSEPIALAGWNTIVPSLAAYSLDGTAQLDAHVEGPVGPGYKPAVSGSFKLSNASISLAAAPKPIENFNVDARFTDTTAKLTNTSLTVGSSRITADATVSSFEPLKIEYTASSPALALNDVRPTPKEGAAQPKPTKKPEVIRDLAVSGSLNVVGEQQSGSGRMTSSAGSVGDIDYEQLSGNFSTEGERLDLSDIAVNLLGGRVTGSGTVMTGDKPSFEFKTNARSLNIVGVLETIPDVAKSHLRGTTNFDVTIAGKGKEWNDIQPTVSGTGFAELMDGALVDVNIMKAIVDEITVKTGMNNLISQRIQAKYPKSFTDRSTAFEELRSTFVIENGKLLVRNMGVKAKDYGFQGVGAIDFSGGLSLDVTMKVSRELTADIQKDFDAVRYLTNSNGQLEVPFLLQGTPPSVSVKPNQDFLNDVIQKALVQEGLNILGDKKLQDGLKDLFKKKKK